MPAHERHGLYSFAVMEFIRGLKNLHRQRDCAVTIGNFDGIHRGHQSIFTLLKAQSNKHRLASAIVIFEPQPTEFFSPENAPLRLMRLRDKLERFKQAGIDWIICLKFDRHMANQDPTEFINDILFRLAGIKCLVVGDDFRFGKDRRGDFDLLKNVGRKKNFDVIAAPSFYIDGERVSSTLVRNALSSGDMERVHSLLGRPYRISGRVVHGDKRGRKLGFPTANIKLYRYQSPLRGIFAARIFGIEDAPLDAVAYAGTRPVYRGEEMMLEVHIFNFDRALYGRRLGVEFVSKIREEGQMRSEEMLLTQIEQDITQAKKIFAIE